MISRFTLREKESVVVIVFVENVTTLFSYTHKTGADKVINFVHANSGPLPRASERAHQYVLAGANKCDKTVKHDLFTV